MHEAYRRDPVAFERALRPEMCTPSATTLSFRLCAMLTMASAMASLLAV